MKGNMKKGYKVAIALMTILCISLLVVGAYCKRGGIKFFISSHLGLHNSLRQASSPIRMRYEQRFAYRPNQNGDHISGKLANTSWPMFRHDPMHTGRSPYQGPETPNFQWEFPTKGLIESSPAVGPDGTVYIGSHDFHLYAFTPAGILKWKFPTLGLIRSSPAIAMDGTIYVGSFDGNLYAIKPSGQIKWSYHTGERVLASPTIAPNNSILITSRDGVLHSVDDEGKLNWKISLEGGVSVSSPTISPTGVVYQATYPGILYAVDLNGDILWQTEFKGTRGIRTTPAVAEDGTIYLGARNGEFYAIHPDGSVKWNFKTNGDIRSSCAIAGDGTIHFGSYDSYLYALNSDGRLKWRFKARNPIEVSPCVDRDGVVYFAAQADKFYAVNSNGSLRWSFRRGVFYTSPVIGPNRTIYDSGDVAVRAVGALFPSVDLVRSGKGVEMRVSNLSIHRRLTDLRIWSRNAAGENTMLLCERIEMDPSSEISRVIPIVGNHSVVVGARLLDPIDGQLLSEKFLFLDSNQ